MDVNRIATRARAAIVVLAVLASWSALFAAQAQEPIKIGFSVSLTGGLASSGKAHLMSKQIWAEEINAKGGLLGRPVKLVYYDDRPTPRACRASTPS
jgi:branched-chain amino acid transport system substrate-binding protein